MVRVGLVEPQPRQALAVDRVDAAAEQAVAQAQRIAVHRDQHDVGQQGDHRRRIEMLPARQPVRRVDALPVAKQRPGAGMERRGVDGIVDRVAHPVDENGQDIPGTLGTKVTNDAAALMRTMATQRGRNADWAESAVRDSVSATEQEALKDIINFVATDVP